MHAFIIRMVKNCKKSWDIRDKNSRLVYTFEYLRDAIQVFALHDAYLIYSPYIDNEIIYRYPESIGFSIKGIQVAMSGLEYMGKSANIVEIVSGLNIFKDGENNAMNNDILSLDNRPSRLLMDSIIRMAAGIFEYRDEDRIGIKLNNGKIYPESPFEHAESIVISTESNTAKAIEYINKHMKKVVIHNDLCMLLNRRVKLMMEKDGEHREYINDTQECIDIIANKLFKGIDRGSADIIKETFREELNVIINKIEEIIDGIRLTDYD